MRRDAHVLDIDNMKCAGCIASVETVLNSFENVEIISISLEDKQAIVCTSRPANDVIDTITTAGFPTNLVYTYKGN